MHKKILYALILLFLVNSTNVIAGKSIPLDFEDKEGYLIPLYKGDRIYFEFDGDNHTIILDDIKEKRVEFDIFIYQNDAKKSGENNLIYAFLDIYRVLKLDLDRDGLYDFEMDISDFDNNKAIIEINKINEVKNNTDFADLMKSKDKNIENVPFYKDNKFRIIIGFIIVLTIIIAIISKYIRNNDNRWSYH